MPDNQTILIVDDEDYFRDRLAKAFDKRGYHTYKASNYDEAVMEIEKYRPLMAVVDLKMPGQSGLEVIRTGMKIHPNMKIVVLTGYGSISTATKAIRLGAFGYLPKPADVGDILNTFHREPNLEIGVDDLKPPSLGRTEWEHINRVLSDSKGNVSEAARRLGIHRRTLQRKLYKYPPKL
jgi:two-component system response regulator RegA